MKKIGIIVLILLICIGSAFSYIQYKKHTLEQHVIDYLTTEMDISKSAIVSSEPFIANLQGDKNWMVSIKLKDDDATYYYYESDGKIILESYTKNGVEH